ncbi:uncharacterized protein Bfra_005680 [Botrytis fragariae]|uniref:Uncharacterized protein n=1 Tax=Botrytis fragariae TaxID=1964551 RepID=A0A8H6ARK0_9HELO|nr:uncharacterized protein Bfra_005680 [Botrytis fragariae]KAF5872322.1 hypothetical protein Bfra_005680 [Botrytis fragariae]
MVEQTFLETGYHVAHFIACQKHMKLRGLALRAILDQCTDPAGTFAKRHNKWLENSINIAENWKGMVKLPKDQILGGAFVDAHRSSPEMGKMLKESAEAEFESEVEDAKTQIRLWVSNDIERFRASLQRDIAQSGADPDRETMLGFFEEWSAWNDMTYEQSCKLNDTELHPECHLIFSTIQFAIKDMKHRLSIIEEAQSYSEYEDRAAANQAYIDVIEAYRTYENPEDPAASDKVYAQEVARHLTQP